jgi:hypothetical protein
VALNPDNKKYKDKVDYYERKLNQKWFMVQFGLPEFNIKPACDETTDPRASKYSKLFWYEDFNQDGAMLSGTKSSSGVTAVYFVSESQCRKHLSKYNRILLDERSG